MSEVNPDLGAVLPGFPELRRYPGTRSFEDTTEDRRLFTGRKDEMEDVCHRIISHRVVVLYAASGTGKSSLLKAGVFPLLRARGYLPLSVRFDARSQRPLPVQLAAEIERECERQRADIYDGLAEADSLFDYFQKAEFWGEDGPIVPVLVLDQFEELFYLHTYRQRETLIRELGALIKGSIASRVVTAATDGSAAAIVPSPPGFGHATSLRVVLSLREDSIGHLLALGTQIPGLMSQAFRLQPLSLESAKNAIRLPATEQLDARYTPPFECENAAVDDLVGWMAEKARLEVTDATTSPAGKVESFVLQIFCERIEEHVIAQRARGQPAGFTADLFPQAKSKERVLQAYYHRKFVQFLRIKSRKHTESAAVGVSREARQLDTSGDHWQARLRLRGEDHLETNVAATAALYQVIRRPVLGWRLLKLLENDLLTRDGRRQPGERSNLKSLRRLTDDDIALLETMRLVRTEPHGGTQLLNLSHDQLATAIHHHSILRALHQMFYLYGTALAILLAGVGWFWQLRLKREAVEAEMRAIATSRELASANAATAKFAKLTAQRAGSESEAISSLALAVQADPADDEAFYDLLSRALNFDLVLPRRLWTGAVPGGDCSIQMDADGRHFAVIAGNKITVWDATRPAAQPVWSVESSTLTYPFELAIGREGERLAGVMPERRTPEKLAIGRQQSNPRWQFVTASKGDKDLQRSPTFLPKEPGSKPTVTLSPRGQWLVVGESASEDSFKLIYNLGTEIKELPPLPEEPVQTMANPPPEDSAEPPQITSVAFHPADELLVITDSKLRCWLWQPTTQKWHILEQASAKRALFSPDGTWLACLFDKGACLWSTAALQAGEWSGQELALPAPSGSIPARVGSLCFSPESQLMYSSGFFAPSEGKIDVVALNRGFVRMLWERTNTFFEPRARSGGSSRYWVNYATSLLRRREASEGPVDGLRAIDATGRWGLEGDRLVDLVGALHSDRFHFFGQMSSTTGDTESPSEPTVAIVSTELVSNKPSPILRQIISHGGVVEWLVVASQRLRVDLPPLGGPGRQALLSSDGLSVMVWEPTTRRVWRADPAGSKLGDESITLTGGWEPLNLTAKRWLVARSTGEPAQLEVWDLQTRQPRRRAIPLPEKAPAPSTSEEVGVSGDGRYLALSYEPDDEMENYVSWIDLQADTLSSTSWSMQKGSGPVDFVHGRMVTEDDTSNGSFKVVSIYSSDSASEQPLPVLGGKNHRFFLHRDGERITMFAEQKDGVAVLRSRRKNGIWEVVSTPQLSGRAEVGTIAESDDGRWLVGLEGDILLAWNIAGKNAEYPPSAPLLRLKLNLASTVSFPSFTASAVFCEGTNVLAVARQGAIALIDLEKWMFEALPEERRAFAQLAASLVSATTSGSHLADSKERFIEPAAELWRKFQVDEASVVSPLSSIARWWLGQESVARPHPFANQTLAEWAAARRDTATLAGVRDALEVSPNDPLSLAMHGWLAAKNSTVKDASGYWDASFYHALHLPGLQKSDEVVIHAYQAKAMNALGQLDKAREAIEAGEEAAKEGGAQVKKESLTLLQEAKDEIQRIPFPQDKATPSSTDQNERN